MFDVGFFELIVIAAIGLFVIGPERLPGAIRTVALWLGRARHFITETRSEFEKQIGADDIRRELHNEQVMRSLEALKRSKEELQESVQSSEHTIHTDQTTLGEQPDPYPQDDHSVRATAEDGSDGAKPKASQPQAQHGDQPVRMSTATDDVDESSLKQANHTQGNTQTTATK